jgi:hypothetical protein
MARLAPHFARLVLLFQAVVLTLIASRILLDPVGASAKAQISLGSPLAMVVAQIGFGAFPLAAAIFVAVCALSARTLRAGLTFVLILDLTALAVRLHAMLPAGGFAQNRGPLIGETAFSVLAVAALIWQSSWLRRSSEPAASAAAAREGVEP